jgi:hypothetical protein
MLKAPNYYDGVPRRLPGDGQVIVHNVVPAQWADQAPGVQGFRAWTVIEPDLAELVQHGVTKPCNCGWSGLPHYRTGFPESAPPPNVAGRLMPASLRRAWQ